MCFKLILAKLISDINCRFVKENKKLILVKLIIYEHDS